MPTTFRQRVSQSMATLPLVVALSAAAWLAADLRNPLLWGGWAVMAAMAYIVVEWNNRFQLLRVRSRMNSATFIVLMTAFPFLHPLSWSILPAACLLLAYFLLFHTYGSHAPQGYVFHSFLPLGIGSILFPPLLLYVPFLLFSAQLNLRALNGKAFAAAFFGLCLPYWLALPYWLWDTDAGRDFLSRWQRLLTPALPDYASVPLGQWVSLTVLILLGLIALSHFWRTAFNDKIRTRQYFHLLQLQLVPTTALLAWYPREFPSLLPILIVGLTPFIAHYFTLAKGRGMNAWFVGWLILLFALAACHYFNLWTLFSNFSLTMV